jgi:hypothetical protein
MLSFTKRQAFLFLYSFQLSSILTVNMFPPRIETTTALLLIVRIVLGQSRLSNINFFTLCTNTFTRDRRSNSTMRLYEPVECGLRPSIGYVQQSHNEK